MAHDPAPVLPAPSTTAFVGPAGEGPVDTPVRVSDLADYRATFGSPGTPPTALDHALDLFFANGGTDAVVVRSAGPGPEQLVPVGGAGGLHALPGPFSGLVLPGVTADHPLAVSAALARCAEERAVLLLDLPYGLGTTSAVLSTDQVGGPRSRVAAYHPWVLVDGADGPVAVPPAGAVAGLLAGAPQDGPAEITGVSGPAVLLTARDADRLTARGVNPIRSFPGRGTVVWGARTLAARGSAEPSERYLPARLLTDHVLTSLEEGMAFVAGRRADPGLGDLVRRRAEDFLDEVWRGGGLVGDRPEEAYLARCDGTTTTRDDLDAGRVVLLVGLATVRPAEFELHRIVLDTSAATGPDVLPRQAAVAAANRLAKERLTVVRRVDLRTLVSADPAETRRRLAQEFSTAADGGTVLLLQEADTVLGSHGGDGRRPRGPGQVRQLLEELSRSDGVPYVLAGRQERSGGPAQPTDNGAPASTPGTARRTSSNPSPGRT